MTIETANRLYELRRKHGFSQEELAEKLGVSRQAVSKWERGEASPDTDNLISLAKIYGLSLDDLVFGEKDKTEENTKNSNCSSDDSNEDNDPDDVIIKDGHFHFEIDKPKNKVKFWLEVPYAIICTIAYLMFGLYNICGGWAHSWIIFISIPIYYSLVEAIYERKFTAFAYPVFATLAYLYIGLYLGNWHPSWLVFVTIPIYYPIAEALDKKISFYKQSKHEL